MTWRARWRRRKRNRALRLLFPTAAGNGFETLIVAVPVREELIAACESGFAAQDFHSRGDLANYVGSEAFRAAATAVRQRVPIVLPNARNKKFTEEGFST